MQPAASRPNEDSFSLWRAIAGRAARVVVGAGRRCPAKGKPIGRGAPRDRFSLFTFFPSICNIIGNLLEHFSFC